MSISQTTMLSKPDGANAIPHWTLAYLRTRNKRRAYDLVIREFKKSEISQAELARRLGKGTDRVCKVLAGPGNWTLDTLSDFLFAIAGAVPKFDLDFPLEKPARNSRGAIDARSDALSIAVSKVGSVNSVATLNALGTPPKSNSASQPRGQFGL